MNRAQRGLDNVQSRPRDVVRWSESLIEDPTSTPEELLGATWALGRAYAELDQIDDAGQLLEEAVKLAMAQGADHLLADIRLSLSGAFVAAGRIPEAVRELDLAEPGLSDPGTRGRHAMQRGFVAMHVGDLDLSLDHYDTALAHLDGGADEHARARSLINRGIANTMTGKMREGRADFLAAQALAEQLGQRMLAAGAAQNLGFYAGRAGDVPEALRWFGRARSLYEELGSPGRVMSLLDSDFSTVLLTGGLYAEAVQAATRAANMAAQAGNKLAEAEARLLVARAELAGHNHEEAEHEAATAATMFRRSDREPWAAIADYVGLLAATAEAAASDELLARTVRIADRLRVSGWWREATEAKTLAGRLAVSVGRLDEARAHLAVVDDGDDRSTIVRAAVLHASATLRLAEGRRNEAKATLSEAMGLIEDQRATLGSSELRAHASINGTEIANLGLRLAVEDGDASEVFEWAERWRAGSLQIAGIKPDPDSRLAAALGELREAHRASLDAANDPFGHDDDRVVVRLEREVRRLNREADTSGRRHQQLPLDEIQGHLGDRVLIEYFIVDSRLNALTADATNVDLHDLGDLDTIEQQLTRLTTSLNRIAHRPPGARTGRRDDALTATVDALDRKLLGGMRIEGHGGVVVVPTRPLQMMPWAALPSFGATSVTVSPSGWLWAGARPDDDYAPEAARALLVCGPDLPGGDEEISRLVELYVDPIVLSGNQATVTNVVEAMGSCDVAHLAAHGRFRSDNPMLSGLLLDDGPLTVYDLESLGTAPKTVILPSCNAARSSVYDGDELLGTAAALLQAGVHSVVAPVTVVPDATVVPDLMVELHRQLLAGLEPAAALAAARHRRSSQPGDEGDGHRGDDALAALSFIAIDSRAHSRPGAT